MHFLDIPNERETMLSQLSEAIDGYSSSQSKPRFSLRVKPSSLADECLARNWYRFRWVKLEVFSGQKARRLERGNNEELRFLDILRGIGCHVEDIDPNRFAKTRKQFKLRAANGHVTGFVDGKIRHETFTRGETALFEAKGYNARRFAGVKRHGLAKAEPHNYGQVQFYLKELSLYWCIFGAYNTNDDEYHFEVITAVESVQAQLSRNAEAIVYSKARPARISETPAFHKCKQCDFADICHRSAPVAINCRSCRECEPVDNGRFRCNKWDIAEIPLAGMEQGCNSHKPVI